MFETSKKFNNEISAIRALEAFETSELHPLIKETIKQRVLKSISSDPVALPKNFSWAEKKAPYIKYIISSLLGFSLLGGTAFAANTSKPGDILFPIKKVEEKVAISLAISEEAQVALEVKFANRRLEELKQIQAQIKLGDSQNSDPSNARTTKLDNENKDAGTNLSLKDNLNKTKRQRIQSKAEVKAQAEVSRAINALAKTKSHLNSSRGNQAASTVDITLLKLRDTENSFNHRDGSEAQTQIKDNENDGLKQQDTDTLNLDLKNNLNINSKNKETNNNFIENLTK